MLVFKNLRHPSINIYSSKQTDLKELNKIVCEFETSQI